MRSDAARRGLCLGFGVLLTLASVSEGGERDAGGSVTAAFGEDRVPVITVPHDYPTIQAAMDAALPGYTVQLDCGVYEEVNIEFQSGVTLVGNPSDPACVVIRPPSSGSALRIIDASSGLVTGITFLEASSASFGGGIRAEGSTFAVTNCRFVDNHASLKGGGFYCHESNVILEDCVFRGGSTGGGCCAHDGAGAAVTYLSIVEIRRCLFFDNHATGYSGGIDVGSSAVSLEECTFVGNSGLEGSGAIGCRTSQATVTIERCLFASNEGTVHCRAGEGTVVAACTNIFPIQDWGGCLQSVPGNDGNFSADPLFCDADAGNLYLQWNSPCLPANSPAGCELIGALGVGGCNSVSVVPETWAQLKGRYR